MERTKDLERKQKIQLLLRKVPQKFSIKEICNLHKYNRNSTRISLNKLVQQNIVACTANPKESRKGEYYALQPIDLYVKVAQSLPDDEELAKTVGYNLTAKLYEGMIFTKKQSKQIIVQDALELYPFIDYEFTNTGEILLRTKFNVEALKENSLLLNISPCLCKGNAEHTNACAMTAGALHYAFSQFTNDKVQVQRVANKKTFCQYKITMKKIVVPDINRHENSSYRQRMLGWI